MDQYEKIKNGLKFWKLESFSEARNKQINSLLQYFVFQLHLTSQGFSSGTINTSSTLLKF